MKATSRIILPLSLTAAMALTAHAQHSIGIEYAGHKKVVGSTNDLGPELALSYRNTLLHIKSDLYWVASAGMVYQSKSMKSNQGYATDAPRFERYRYGAGMGTGFLLKGPIMNVELGIGLSRHYVHSNQLTYGLFPAVEDFDPGPLKKELRTYTLFDVSFGLSHDISDSVQLRSSLGIHMTANKGRQQQFFRTGIGMLISFERLYIMWQNGSRASGGHSEAELRNEITR